MRVSLLSINGTPLQEAGTPANSTVQPTAYPVPKAFESRVKLAVLTNDTVRDGVRLASEHICVLCAARSGLSQGLLAHMHASLKLVVGHWKQYVGLEHWLKSAESTPAEDCWASQHGGSKGHRCCVSQCVGQQFVP